MGEPTVVEEQCGMDPKDLELLILKLRELAQSLDEPGDARYIQDLADEVGELAAGGGRHISSLAERTAPF